MRARIEAVVVKITNVKILFSVSYGASRYKINHEDCVVSSLSHIHLASLFLMLFIKFKPRV